MVDSATPKSKKLDKTICTCTNTITATKFIDTPFGLTLSSILLKLTKRSIPTFRRTVSVIRSSDAVDQIKVPKLSTLRTGDLLRVSRERYG